MTLEECGVEHMKQKLKRSEQSEQERDEWLFPSCSMEKERAEFAARSTGRLHAWPRSKRTCSRSAASG